MNLETEELLKVDEERFKLLRRCVLRARQEHTAEVRLMVYDVDQNFDCRGDPAASLGP